MFPLRWNFPFRKKDGSLVNIGDAMGGDYSLPTASTTTKGGIKVGDGLTMDGEKLKVNMEPELPDYGVEEAGKFLGVDNAGELTWTSGGGSLDYGLYTDFIIGRAMFTPATVADKYNAGINHNPVASPVSNQAFDAIPHSLDEVFLPDKFDISEFYKYVTDELIEGLDLVTLASELTAVTEVTLETPITNYSVMALQGCYDSTGKNNSYDTTIFYSSPEIGVSYVFAVKDRNASYSGTLTFTDATHATITASGGSGRRVKIFGIV